MTAKEYNELKEGTPIKITDPLEQGRVTTHYIKYDSLGTKGIMVGTIFYSYKNIELVKEK